MIVIAQTQELSLRSRTVSRRFSTDIAQGKNAVMAAHGGVTTATVVAIQRANPAEPDQAPLLVLGSALADRDERAPRQ
jgi:hypothetical protein